MAGNSGAASGERGVGGGASSQAAKAAASSLSAV